MRIAILSDVHANLPALEAILAAIGRADAWWHLGDVVGYGPHPDEVVGRLREIGALGVRGNHDAAALDPGLADRFNPAARRAIEWTAARLAPETRAWLAELPERREEGGITLVHGSPRDPIWEYVTGIPVARACFSSFETALLFHGHTHEPIAFREERGRLEAIPPHRDRDLTLGDRRAMVNPGSVGQPRDGDARASALVLDTVASAVRWVRARYDVGATQADIRAAGLPAALAARLAVGR